MTDIFDSLNELNETSETEKSPRAGYNIKKAYGTFAIFFRYDRGEEYNLYWAKTCSLQEAIKTWQENLLDFFGYGPDDVSQLGFVKFVKLSYEQLETLQGDNEEARDNCVRQLCMGDKAEDDGDSFGYDRNESKYVKVIDCHYGTDAIDELSELEYDFEELAEMDSDEYEKLIKEKLFPEGFEGYTESLSEELLPKEYSEQNQFETDVVLSSKVRDGLATEHPCEYQLKDIPADLAWQDLIDAIKNNKFNSEELGFSLDTAPRDVIGQRAGELYYLQTGKFISDEFKTAYEKGHTDLDNPNTDEDDVEEISDAPEAEADIDENPLDDIEEVDEADDMEEIEESLTEDTNSSDNEISEDELKKLENYFKAHGLDFSGEYEETDNEYFYTDLISYNIEYKDNKYIIDLSIYHASEDNNMEYQAAHTDQDYDICLNIVDLYENYPEIVKELYKNFGTKLNEDFEDRENAFDRSLSYLIDDAGDGYCLDLLAVEIAKQALKIKSKQEMLDMFEKYAQHSVAENECPGELELLTQDGIEFYINGALKHPTTSLPPIYMDEDDPDSGSDDAQEGLDRAKGLVPKCSKIEIPGHLWRCANLRTLETEEEPSVYFEKKEESLEEGIVFSDNQVHCQIKDLLDTENQFILNRLQAGRMIDDNGCNKPYRLNRQELEQLKDEYIYYEDDGDAIYARFEKPVNEIRELLGLPKQSNNPFDLF